MRWKLPKVKSSPFSRDEDIPHFMAGFLVREAEAEGKPLTEEEVRYLEAPAGQCPLTTECRARLEELIAKVMRKNEPRLSEDSRTFLTAVEWADMEDALIVAMSVEILSDKAWRP